MITVMHIHSDQTYQAELSLQKQTFFLALVLPARCGRYGENSKNNQTEDKVFYIDIMNFAKGYKVPITKNAFDALKWISVHKFILLTLGHDKIKS